MSRAGETPGDGPADLRATAGADKGTEGTSTYLKKTERIVTSHTETTNLKYELTAAVY